MLSLPYASASGGQRVWRHPGQATMSWKSLAPSSSGWPTPSAMQHDGQSRAT